MFDLAYNIDFEIFGILMTVLLYIETDIHYPHHTSRNRIFRKMALFVIITTAFDIISSLTITYGPQVPNALNVLCNSGYFMSGLFLCFLLHYYLQTEFVPSKGKTVLLRLNKYLLILAELSFIPNIWLGYYFTITPAGAYLHGPLYLLNHLLSCWFVLCASTAILVNLRQINRERAVSGFLLVLIYFAAVILQTFVLTNVLIIMPAVSIMLCIVAFSLESPDYVQLQEALQTLSQTQRELQEANEKLSDLAYMDMMTGLKNRSAYELRISQLGNEGKTEEIIFLIADINDLKGLNDHYCHLIGDDAIVQTAKLIEKSFDHNCECYRIGGDEFAVISVGLSEADFSACYERFMESVDHAQTWVTYPFSVAAGYQVVDHENLVEAQKAADKSMYIDKLRKKEGRG